jgi:polyferredoxin/formate hydrogenlyase subunit 6/NADH:ubiquinone oxidoreductase subunit I
LKRVRFRQISQALFLALFLALAWKSEAPNLFLQADPLAALLNAFSTHALYRGLLFSLAILIPTFFLGRFFCGWICPLGTLNHLVSGIPAERKRGRRLLDSNRYHPRQKLKYAILLAGLLAAALGSGLLALLDPLSLLARTVAIRTGLVTFGTLLTILLLNLRVTRFWCRVLCPLGALLGAASRWSLLRLDKRADRCGDCNRCLLHCQGADDPVPGSKWRRAECHLCFNCVADCPDAGLAFRFGSPARPDQISDGPEPGRRRALTGLAAGAALVPLLRAGPHEKLLRPPGALDEPAFLARCLRCGECIRVCRPHALHSSLFESGLEELWTPVVVPRIGYCQPSCVLCAQACPSGAIRRFTPQEKGWQGDSAVAPEAPIRIGTAFFDRGRCLPWAMATECLVCEEWCPVSPKAVYLREADVPLPDGGTKKLRQPYIAADRCVGCGACECACPVHNRPAVYVMSIGETRSKTNRLLLRRPTAPSLPTAAPGWQKTGPTRTFDAANLWQYLDGGADKYVDAGLVTTLTAPYRYSGNHDAILDLHLFRTAQGAARLFDSEPAAGSTPLALGDGARLYSTGLFCRRGRALIRITAFDELPPAAPAALARAMIDQETEVGI